MEAKVSLKKKTKKERVLSITSAQTIDAVLHGKAATKFCAQTPWYLWEEIPKNWQQEKEITKSLAKRFLLDGKIVVYDKAPWFINIYTIQIYIYISAGIYTTSALCSWSFILRCFVICFSFFFLRTTSRRTFSFILHPSDSDWIRPIVEEEEEGEERDGTLAFRW